MMKMKVNKARIERLVKFSFMCHILYDTIKLSISYIQ